MFPILTVADVPVRHPDADVAGLAPHAHLTLPARAHLAALVRPGAAAVEAVHAAVADLGMKTILISENEIICTLVPSIFKVSQDDF